MQYSVASITYFCGVMKAVFLDRDGVLNKELGRYVATVDELEFNDQIITFLKPFKEAGYEFFIITNQGGIARGIYTLETLMAMHRKLLAALSKNGIEIREVYYCPHHPNYSKCLCRKPDSLMIEKAIAKYKVDRKKSFMIGDTDRDMGAAEKAGIFSIKVESNKLPDEAALQRLSDFLDQ